MITAFDLLSGNWLHALGWTLLNSLWQGALITTVTLGILRLIPVRESALRYSSACVALALLVLSSFITFGLLYEKEAVAWAARANAVAYHQVSLVPEQSATGFLPALKSFIDTNLAVLISAWALGCLIFTLRLAAGVFYTNRLRMTATILDGSWDDMVKKFASRMRITRNVQMGESPLINTPMVIGFLKPLILIPAGMVSGLSTEQLETILLHELAHIRRHDYIINFLQSVIETLFFFNPFVWILSSEIRREREYCCDDAVVNFHGGTRAYAHALVQIAEARLAAPALAVTLANDKNQLLHRIKRLMESSVSRPPEKKRLLAGLLVLAGALVSISWISIGGRQNVDGDSVTHRDTVPGKVDEGLSYSRKSIVTIDENGQPHEEIIENFEGDTSLRRLMDEQFGLPNIGQMPAFPDLHLDPMDPGLPGFSPFDTIPGQKFGMTDEAFRQLNESLRKHLEDLFSGRLDPHTFRDEFDREFNWDQWQRMAPDLDSLERFREFGSEEWLEELQDNIQRHFDQLVPDHFPEFDFHGGHIDRYEDALTDQLRLDGYLSQDEAIESLQWNDDTFIVNGKALKQDDLTKYKKLKEKHFRSSQSQRKE